MKTDSLAETWTSMASSVLVKKISQFAFRTYLLQYDLGILSRVASKSPST